MHKAFFLQFELVAVLFFGADAGITDYTQGVSGWVATVIIKERRLEDAYERHGKVIDNIKRQMKLKICSA